MKTKITKFFALLMLMMLSSHVVMAQTGAVLLDTNFENWKPTVSTDQANGTYNVPNASVKIQGPKFNTASTPNAGTNSTYPNYFRFGTVGSTTNNFLDFTPSSPFVNGGRVTLVISTNANPSATNVFSIADAEKASVLITDVLVEFNQIGKTHNVVSFDLPTTFTGTKTIRVFRTEVTTFLHAIKIETNLAGPTVALSSGSNATSAMATLAITPAVYTYSNVADVDAQYEWYTDNTYTTVATAPAGLSITKNTTDKTISVNGVPTTIGTYYYKVWVAGGNAIEGSVVVAAYVTPAPIIELNTANSVQVVKANTAIANITYNIQHATNATVSGLPNGLTAAFVNGVLTISGTVDAAVAPNTYNYTVNTTVLTGYTGEAVTATGSVVVKAANAKNVLYLVGGASVDAKDTQLYPMLNDRNDLYLTVKTALSTAPAASVYDAFDLIVIAESVAGANVEAIALKSVDKPILNFKSFLYNTGRWVWGTADNGAANNGAITVTHTTHPVFAGITLSSGAFDVLTGAATKGIQPADVTLEGGYALATAPKANNVDAIAIHDVPAGARSVVNSKYIMIPVANDSYDKFSADGLLLVTNAVEYLLNGAQYVPAATSNIERKTSSVYFDGQRIVNPERELIKMFDATGRLVRTASTDISTKDLNKGIYIVIAKDIKIKIVL